MSAAKIVVYGATGYTGGLVARALAGRDAPLVVAGRSPERVGNLAAELGAEMLVADAGAPDGRIQGVLEPGDVLVSTVGPFVRLGAPAVEAAVRTGAHYVDSTGEAAFIRRVFDEWGPRADGASLLLTAFGYDWVPGNLACGLALREAGTDATAVDVGYFNEGQADPRTAMSSGTLATSVGQTTHRQFAYRDGRLIDLGLVPARRSFPVKGAQWQAMSIPGTEHFDLPEAFPHLQDVGTYVGWFGPATPVVQGVYGAGAVLSRLPGGASVMRGVSGLLSRRTGVGPDEQARAKLGSLIVAEARAADGTVLSTVTLRGPNGYTLTGDLIAWAAHRLATAPPDATGARGPITAFGLEDLEAGCASLGLERST